MKKKMKPWGGRFQEPTDEFVEQFTASVGYDKRLAAYDIMGSIAHAQTLAHVGVLNKKESESIVEGLKTIKADIDRGKFDWRIDLEDVHMNIESALVERIGEVGKKLHTGRSRNDQVATDLRLFLREAIDTLQGELHAFQTVLVDRAEQEAATLMPGLTHLQIAQPVTLGHHFLAWFEMLQRDGMRLQECRARVNLMPLGAAALAGTSFPIDRRYTAELLGFDGLCQNSLDAVSDRDFVTEFISASTLLMIHLSRMAEELILWSSDLVGFVGLSDRYCTGSSIMPPKKNPDVPELVRGKSGRVSGNLISLLMMTKGQPLAYNKDNQEDKEPLFDTIDTVHGSLKGMSAVIESMTIHRDKMAQALRQGYATATDLADYLVKKNIPFRDAHEMVGKIVHLAIDQKLPLDQLDLKVMQQVCRDIDEKVFQVLQPQGSVESRNIVGGTAPEQVKQAVNQARELIKRKR